MPEYRTVFTILEKPVQPWLQVIVPAVVVVLTAIALVAFLKFKTRRVLVGVLYVISIFTTVLLSRAGISDMYGRARETYARGDYSIAEGEVTEFHPMPYSGHQRETFSVNGVQFSYSDYVINPCFNNTASHGGPIRAGERVRIAYSGDCIFKLEIKEDELPTASDRAATADSAKRGWRQEQEHDPFLNRTNLGFAIAIVFITAWWNVQPQRFMRFWAKPPYKTRTITLFRMFFAANFIGALWHVFAQFKSFRASAFGFGGVMEIAAAWIAVMWVMVVFQEWMANRQGRHV
jgi:hypothetical protein